MEQAPFSDEVAEGVRAGDPDALGVVWGVLAPSLVSYLRAQVRESHLGEDLAEDTFLELVRSCRTIDGGPYAIRGWVYRAATRNLIDHRRVQSRRREDLVEVLPDCDDPRPGPAEQVEAADLAGCLHRVLARLTPDQRQVLTLRFLAGLTAPEVAVVMGKPEGAVRALQHRAAAAFVRLAGNSTASLVGASSPGPAGAAGLDQPRVP